MTEFAKRLREISGSTKDEVGAANDWAGTKGLELLGALNAKAGTTGLGLGAVVRKLTGGKGEPIPELSRAYPFNLALGKTVTFSQAGSGGATKVTDGITSSGEFGGGITGAGSCTVDLGSTYQVGTVKVWHYWLDGRTYNATKVDVSADGTTWTTVFDSGASGTYAEVSGGKTHTFTRRQVRYVRDFINGSSANASNHWVEIQAYA